MSNAKYFFHSIRLIQTQNLTLFTGSYKMTPTAAAAQSTASSNTELFLR